MVLERILRVDDVEAFAETLAAGVGRQRGTDGDLFGWRLLKLEQAK
jgi:hypothetical protein